MNLTFALPKAHKTPAPIPAMRPSDAARPSASDTSCDLDKNLSKVENTLNLLIDKPPSTQADRIRELEDIRRYRNYRAIANRTWTLCRTAFAELAWTCSSILISQRLTGLITPLSPVHTGSDNMGLTYLSAVSFSELIRELRSFFIRQDMDRDALKNTHGTLTLRFKEEKNNFSEINIKAINTLDDRISCTICDDDTTEAENLIKLRQHVIFSMPKHIQDVSYQHIRGDIKKEGVINAAVTDLISRFPHLDIKTLATFFGAVRSNCYLPNPTRQQLYLWGSPGTGKTFFADQAAKALGLPIVHLTLSQSEIKEIGGHPRTSSGNSTDNLIDYNRQQMGPLPCALASCGVVNPILFFDEFASMLRTDDAREGLKKLLDPDFGTFRVRSIFGFFEVDISRTTFIFAGNEPIEDPALATRLKQLKFGALSENHKTRLIEHLIDQEIVNHTALGPERLTQLREAMRAHKQYILEEDQRRGIPGVRTAIAVTKETIHFVHQKLVDPIYKDLCVEEFIRDAFNAREPVRTKDEKAQHEKASGCEQSCTSKSVG